MFALLPYWLKVVVAFGVLLSIVPLTGLAITGSWRAAWQYCRSWGRVMLITIAAALVVLLALGPIMLPP